MCRCCVVSVVSLAGLSGVASAADLHSEPAPYPVQQLGSRGEVPEPSWDGAYIGDHAGDTWADLAAVSHGGGRSLKNKMSRAVGGGQFGYNVQAAPFVYGLEVDLGGMNLGHYARSAGDSPVTSSVESGYYGDVTARFGMPIRNLLLYCKGGFAFYDGSVSFSVPGTAVTGTSGLSGLTSGAGIELALSEAWSAKAEYQYFNFGGMQITDSAGQLNSSLTVNTVKIGINYHFREFY